MQTIVGVSGFTQDELHLEIDATRPAQLSLPITFNVVGTCAETSDGITIVSIRQAALTWVKRNTTLSRQCNLVSEPPVDGKVIVLNSNNSH